jgi:hypothetical protein
VTAIRGQSPSDVLIALARMIEECRYQKSDFPEPNSEWLANEERVVPLKHQSIKGATCWANCCPRCHDRHEAAICPTYVCQMTVMCPPRVRRLVSQPTPEEFTSGAAIIAAKEPNWL